MRKSHRGRGGRNYQNIQSRNSNGNGHSNNGKSMWCNHCKKDNHTTENCKRNPHNNSNRVDKKNHNTKKHSNGGSNNESQNHKKQNRNPCTVCGIRGHDRKSCCAKEVPEDQQCECGCAFHRSNQCPWNNDPLERDAADAQATGKICQWCKDAGDGIHVYEECKEPKQFRNQLLKIILRAYDELKWCWHCSATNHATRSCSATPADQDKSRWNVAISNIISQWIDYDSSAFEVRHRDNDEDVDMIPARNAQRPPIPADFKWCIICEEFGHLVNDGLKDCNHIEYDRKCPVQFRSRAITAKQPFVPIGFNTNTNANSSVIATNAVGAQSTSYNGGKTTFSQKCSTQGCHAKLSWTLPCPKWGEQIVCPKCELPNSHPLSLRRDSKLDFLQMVLELIEQRDKKVDSAKKRKVAYIDSIKNPYLKRPSIALTKKLAVHTWPSYQPSYTDLTTRLNKSPVYKNNGSYFNEPGNHQTYFPASKFRIRPEMEEIALNDEFCINKAGRLGLQLSCVACGTPALIADDEGDVVMCGTEGMCTVGCGGGVPYWCDELGRPKGSCRCLAIIGQVPDVKWMVPSR